MRDRASASGALCVSDTEAKFPARRQVSTVTSGFKPLAWCENHQCQTTGVKLSRRTERKGDRNLQLCKSDY